MYLNWRATILLLIAIGTALLGTAVERWAVAHLGVCLAFWIAIEWFVFRYHLNSLSRCIRVKRQICDKLGEVNTLWENQPYSVSTFIEIPRVLGRTHLSFRERIPKTGDSTHRGPDGSASDGSERNTSGSESGIIDRGNLATCISGSAKTICLLNEIHATNLGAMRFQGIYVRFTNLCGLFWADRFVHAEQSFPVFPPVVKMGSLTTQTKRFNRLQPPGVHRHQQPGIGSELLEIRDYVPGDSPRSIAWKLSAKRGNLMSKQFESEVPICCTMFIDTANSVRLGYPGPTSLSNFARLATTIIETLTAHRDPVGITFFDESSIQVLQPTASRRKTLQMAKQLSAECSAPATPVNSHPNDLLPTALELVRECYPDTIRQSVLAKGFQLFPVLPWQRITANRRFRVASVLATRYELPAGSIGSMMGNDQLFSEYAQRFLGDFQVPYPGPLFGPTGEYLFHDAKKVANLARVLQHRTARGRDNEMYIIMADLLHVFDDLAPLVKAIRYATARHHRVVVVCAWPAEMSPPRKDEQQFDSPIDERSGPWVGFASDVARQLGVGVFLKHTRLLGRQRVPVICAVEPTVPQFLLAQIDLIRAGRMAKA